MNKRLFLRHLLIFAVVCVLLPVGCPVYRIFGIPCPCCGVTRAWLRCLSGDVRGAFAYNAFFLLIPGAVLLFAHRDALPTRWKRPADICLIAFGAALFLYNLLRWLGIVIMP